MPVPYSSWSIRLDRVGDVVTASGIIAVTSSFSGFTYQKADETVPDGFRPVSAGTILLAGNNGQVWNIRANADGECWLSGSSAIGYQYAVLGSWIAA